MPRFNPSTPYDVAAAYGDPTAAEASEKPTTGEVLEEYAPAISSLLFGGDPRQQYEKKKAQLENYKRLHDSAANAIMRGLYANKIRTLQGEIRALEEQAGEERAAVVTTQMGKIGGIALLAAGTVTVLVIGNYFRQKAATEKLQRKALRAQLG